MTFSYTLPITANLDRVRLHIADTQETPHVFEDEEIDELLVLENDDVLLASARALRIMAADGSRLAIAMQVPGLNLQSGSAADKLLMMAEQFEAQAAQRAAPTSLNVFPDTDQYLDAVTGAYDLDYERPGIDT